MLLILTEPLLKPVIFVTNKLENTIILSYLSFTTLTFGKVRFHDSYGIRNASLPINVIMFLYRNDLIGRFQE